MHGTTPYVASRAELAAELRRIDALLGFVQLEERAARPGSAEHLRLLRKVRSLLQRRRRLARFLATR